VACALKLFASVRVTRILKKLPNFWESSQNCSQNIKVQFSCIKLLLKVKISTRNNVLKLFILMKIAKMPKQKVAKWQISPSLVTLTSMDVMFIWAVQ